VTIIIIIIIIIIIVIIIGVTRRVVWCVAVPVDVLF
jgi:hypothetical protein